MALQFSDLKFALSTARRKKSMSQEEINVALLGFGTVGTGVYKVMQRQKPEMMQKLDVSLNIRYILVRNVQRHMDKVEDPEILGTISTIEFILVITIGSYIDLNSMNFSDPFSRNVSKTFINLFRHFLPVVCTIERIKSFF